MTKICYVLIAAVQLLFAGSMRGSDVDLIVLMKNGYQSSAILNYLESDTAPSGVADQGSFALRTISAFDVEFAGRLSLKSGVNDEIAMWTVDPMITPKAAMEIFGKVSKALRNEYGTGETIENIPNYGDATDVQSTAELWQLGTDIILLQVDVYPSRAGLKIARLSKESWRQRMGADESDFWSQKLTPKTGAALQEDLSSLQKPDLWDEPRGSDQTDPKQVPVTESVAITSSETRTDTMQWVIIATVVLLAFMLLLFVFKRR